MARKEFSGGGRIFANGSLLADATNIDVNAGGNSTRIITTGGNTGEVKSDPTMCKISVTHAVPKTGTDVKKVRRWHARSTDVTWRVTIGNDVATVIGKVTTFKMGAAPGKGEFSFEIEGDIQDPG